LRIIYDLYCSAMMSIAARKPILLVEDDADIRESISDVLRSRGLSVITAVHGADALQLLQRGERPGLILLDLQMPVMDGWAFLTMLRTLELPRIPIVALSATLTRPPPSVDAFCTKPIELQRLLWLVSYYGRA
jgi:CheY-like chemotaxis protein